MKRNFFIAVLAFALAVSGVRADEAATEQLLGHLQALERLQGSFSQTQYAADDDQALVVSSGSFRLLKPLYFSWEIDSPDSQLILADGEHLWHYDRDLETVTRRPVSSQGELSPLQVLGGDADILRQRFTVSNTGKGRYLLQPLGDGNPGFRELTLVFAGNTISGMEILDNLNQRLFIEFSELNSHSPLAAEDFRFTPPAGADLFYHDQ